MKSNYNKLERPLQEKEPGDDPEIITFHTSSKTPRNCFIALLVTLLIVAILLVITLAILYGVNSSSESSSTTQDVCQTDACFDLSVQILASMDDTADPCEDFYNFTCGNWDIYQHIRPGWCISSLGMYSLCCLYSRCMANGSIAMAAS